ncbi:MAG: pirin family protein [Nitrososphaera sp.]
MIDIRTADRHFKSDLGWLTSYHHFSFADYHDPENINFGPLRVFNDDLIRPGTGFGFHPHRDMEIITYVIEGELEHRDNQGNHGIVHPGEVQVMTAGSGIVHSEYNHSKEKPLRLLQIWIFANERGLKPSWKQEIFAPELGRNKFLNVVGPENSSETRLSIHQDARIYISSLDKGSEVIHHFAPERTGYLFAIAGELAVNNSALSERSSMRINRVEELSIAATIKSEVILIDMAEKFRINGIVNEATAIM